MTITLLAVSLLSAAFAAPMSANTSPNGAQGGSPPAAAAPAGKPAVKASTGTAAASEITDPSQIYTAEKLRDPFRTLSASSGGDSTHQFTIADFNIHNLSLRGMMRDRRSDYALFSDPAFSITFILRAGRLYDNKGRVVPGVTGALDLRRKTAHLQTGDSDVQTFRLGEEGLN